MSTFTSDSFPTRKGNAVHHYQPSTGGGSPEPGVAAYDATKASNSVDARAALAESGGMAQSTGPVRSFIEWLRFHYRWHFQYKPLLRKPIPATPQVSEELRRRLFQLQRPVK